MGAGGNLPRSRWAVNSKAAVKQSSLSALKNRFGGMGEAVAVRSDRAIIKLGLRLSDEEKAWLIGTLIHMVAGRAAVLDSGRNQQYLHTMTQPRAPCDRVGMIRSLYRRETTWTSC